MGVRNLEKRTGVTLCQDLDKAKRPQAFALRNSLKLEGLSYS